MISRIMDYFTGYFTLEVARHRAFHSPTPTGFTKWKKDGTNNG